MKNKLKLAFIVNRKPSLGSGGEVRNYYLLEALKKRFDVKVYIPTFNHIGFLDKNGEVKPIEKVLCLLKGKIPYVEKLRKARFTHDQIEEIKQANIVQIQEMESYFTVEKFFNEISGKTVLDTHNIDYVR